MTRDTFGHFRPPSRERFGGNHGRERENEQVRKSDLVDVEMIKFGETTMAILVGRTERRRNAVWLPKSQIEIESHDGQNVTVTMPEWLAKQHGLI